MKIEEQCDTWRAGVGRCANRARTTGACPPDAATISGEAPRTEMMMERKKSERMGKDRGCPGIRDEERRRHPNMQ